MQLGIHLPHAGSQATPELMTPTLSLVLIVLATVSLMIAARLTMVASTWPSPEPRRSTRGAYISQARGCPGRRKAASRLIQNAAAKGRRGGVRRILRRSPE